MFVGLGGGAFWAFDLVKNTGCHDAVKRDSDE